jgi:serine/threonine-protein kinase
MAAEAGGSNQMIEQTLAHYRSPPSSAGGMSEVYRATDTKLHREVVIKVLPESFAQDAERMARFNREAHVLASLNHPNIAQIYRVEDHALVMELGEGETLTGQLPLDTALDYARQIADALEAAHEKGDWASRSEASQHQSHPKRHHEGGGLRVGESR